MGALIGGLIDVLAAAFQRMMAPLLERLLPYLGRFFLLKIQWFFLVVWPWIVTTFLARVQQVIAGTAIRTAVLTVWGIFLGVLWTGMSGLSLAAIFASNPLAGIPAAMLYLASYGFPLKYAIGLCVAYIQFRMTLNIAAIQMSRTIKFLFGG